MHRNPLPARFRDIAPAFAEELGALLLAAGEPQLAAQMRSAEVVDRCRCGDHFCASFYTAPPPGGAYGPGLKNVQLDPRDGMVILDVVDGRLMQVEVLHNATFRRALHDAVP